MASPDSSGRILRIEDADNTAQEPDNTPRFDRAGHIIVAKPCVVPGCTGTMDFHKRFAEAAPPPLEWPWYSTWQCRQDATHFRLISHAEEDELTRRAFARERNEARLRRANAERIRALRKNSK